MGRQDELGVVERFVRDMLPGGERGTAGDGPRVLLISGPAGIGKSALWAAALGRAQSLDLRTLTARPTEAEAAFAYAALADLLRDAWPDLQALLPRPQLRSLEAALGWSDQIGEPIDPPLVQSAAANGLLRLAAARPLLIAIDDVPWLDGPSAAVVGFVGRRMTGRPIGLLLAQRADEPTALPASMGEGIPPDHVEHVWLGPLSVGALHRLLDERLGLSLPRPQLVRLHELSGGVPFHALEIGRALQRSPAQAGGSLPIPRSLRDLLASRTSRLRPVEREALLLIAAAGRLPIAALDQLLGAEQARTAVSSAVDEGLMAVDGDVVRPGHPLIASTVYEEAPASQRRAVHARLADVTADPEARARHRALATIGANESVAAELEAAGRRTLERGAPDAAVEVLRLAVERTPPARSGERARRALALADALHRAADLPAAGRTLDEVVAADPPPGVLARAQMLRSEVAWYTSTARDAVAAAMAGLAAATDEPELQADLHFRLAIFHDYDAARARMHARRAVELLEEQDRPALLASALMTVFGCEVAVGNPPPLDLLERALAVEPPDTRDATTLPGIWWVALDDADAARRRFAHLLELDRRYGQLSSEADLLTRLAEVELFADNYAAAREHADAATAAARQHGDEAADPARRVRALVDAHEGLLGHAEAVAREAYERTAAAGDHRVAGAWLVVSAFAAATRGDHAEVIRVGELSADHFRQIGVVEPLRLSVDHERLEALAALGRAADAEPLLTTLERRQALIPRPWLAASLARARALLRLADGDVTGAVRETEAALDDSATRWRRLDRARTLLLRGAALRRGRAPREAAIALDEAQSIFEAIGAAAWARRVGDESARLGRHRRGTDELTPSEARVANLAASGLTNRQMAERMAVSTKTIEAHLARVYTKLDIHSRAELGRLMAGRADERGGAT